MVLSMELYKQIKELSSKNDIPQSLYQDQVKLMQEYRKQGCKHGDNIQGYIKWYNSLKDIKI